MNPEVELNNQIFKVAGLLEKAGNHLFSRANLTVKTYAILTAISEGCNKSTDLANYMLGSKAGITQKTKSLETQGLIKRNIDKKDKRVWHFVLTSKGKKALQNILPLHKKAAKHLYCKFSKKEKNQALSFLKAIERHLHFVISKKHLAKHNLLKK